MVKILYKFPEILFFQEGPGVRNHQYTTSGVKLLNVSNLRNGKIDLTTSDRYISENEAFNKYSHFLCDPNDFIIASSGIKIDSFDSKMGFIHQSDLPVCMNTSTIRFKVLNKEVLEIRYFMYYLKSIVFKKVLSKVVTGSAQLNFGPSHLKNMSISLPNLDIQKTIVQRLDRVNNLIEIKRKLLFLLDELVKSRFVEMFGNPIINDKKYPVFKLKDISQKIGSGVTPRGGDSNYIDKGVAFIRSMNVYNNTFRKDNLVYIDKSLAKQLSQVELFSNDLLLNITGASVARCCTVPDDILPARVNQHVCIIRQCRISNVFLEYCLTNESYQEYLLLLSNKNGATREALTKIQVENLEVIFPPLTEITRFVRLVHQINKLKSDVQKSIDETQLLMDSLMQEYFG